MHTSHSPMMDCNSAAQPTVCLHVCWRTCMSCHSLSAHASSSSLSSSSAAAEEEGLRLRLACLAGDLPGCSYLSAAAAAAIAPPQALQDGGVSARTCNVRPCIPSCPSQELDAPLRQDFLLSIGWYRLSSRLVPYTVSRAHQMRCLLHAEVAARGVGHTAEAICVCPQVFVSGCNAHASCRQRLQC